MSDQHLKILSVFVLSWGLALQALQANDNLSEPGMMLEELDLSANLVAQATKVYD